MELVFLYFLIIFNPLFVLLDPLKPSFKAHSLQIHCVGLFGPNPSTFWAQESKRRPYNWRCLWVKLELN